MKNHDFTTQRRMLAYVTLLSGNIQATHEFLVEYADKLPFSSRFIDCTFEDFASLSATCDYIAEELIKRLSITHSTLEAFLETH